MPQQDKLWAGVFGAAQDRVMDEFNASIGFDSRMYNEDISGSIAYARALKRAKVITATDLVKLEKGLEQLRVRIAEGTETFTVADEDIHMGIEARLAKLVGKTAARLHTGRSRNEQVVVDERLYLKKCLVEIDALITGLQRELVKFAAKHIKVIMPGYTHLQQGQLIRFSHYLMALFYMLQRDKGRLRDCYKRADFCPLGSGALAGNALNLDRKFLARQLGFSGVTENSIDTVTDRDFILEFLSGASILLTHLSRYAEDVVIWSMTEIGFIKLDDRYATGSSLMPQKKNPDSMELIRGKTGRVFGNLQQLFTVMKGLPLTYGKDLQEDKEPMLDTVDTVTVVLKVFTGALATMKVQKKDINTWVTSAVYATDLVEHYVRNGMPFRDAHHTVGAMIKNGTYDEALIEAGIADPQTSVDRKNDDGGTSLASVKNQIVEARKLLRQKGLK